MNPTTLVPKQEDFLKPQDYLSDLLQLTKEVKLFLEKAKQHQEEFELRNLNALQEQAQLCAQEFKVATYLAEKALGTNAISSGFKQIAIVARVIKAWPKHPKQKEILSFLNKHEVNPQIIRAVDEAITEDQGSLLALLHLDLKAELIVMLESQVEQFSFHAEQFSFALGQERQLSLTKLLGEKPIEAESAELMFDPFTKGLMSVSDMELTIVAITVLAMLKGTS